MIKWAISAFLLLILMASCNQPKTDILDNCMGNTQAAPCNVKTDNNGNVYEWTTNRGD